ncbi:uncharacterized protein [Halyomorpha halys]|nr:uncharacterized protein LOC106684685 isoform X2 [Halyomorpha halys]XP_014282397.1 uncharacterized protein LOC106684685 isoform X2 [Halyomorpha halys]
MPEFQLILKDWVKTSGFLSHELVKRFFLFYPLLCIASDCYLQVQVAFQAWFETIENAAAAPDSQAPAPTPNLAPEISISSNREPGSVEPDSYAVQGIDVGEAVRGFFTEELESQESNAEE